MSFNQVVGSGTANAVASFPGFRYATAAEVTTFWQDAGVVIGQPNRNAVEALVFTWGLTGIGGGSDTLYYSQAITQDPGMLSSPPSNHLLAGLNFTAIPPIAANAGISDSRYDTVPSPDTGSALVRGGAVPEPPAFALGAIAAIILSSVYAICGRSWTLLCGGGRP